MKIIYNGQQIEIDEGMSLRQFAEQENLLGSGLLVNGLVTDSNTILAAYNVVEIDPSGTVMDRIVEPVNIDVELTDFTGHSGMINTLNSIGSIRDRYETDVAISIIRDNQPINTEELQTGDRVMVMPSGGVKGA